MWEVGLKYRSPSHELEFNNRALAGSGDIALEVVWL